MAQTQGWTNERIAARRRDNVGLVKGLREEMTETEDWRDGADSRRRSTQLMYGRVGRREM
jgi:hypothetical protein